MSLAGKHIVITGPTAGIGRVTALELAKQGAFVTLLCRNPNKAQELQLEIKNAGGDSTAVALDLASLASVRTAAAELLQGRRIDVLINNAGQASLRGTTADGFEMAFGVNHLGHFLLTNLVLPHVNNGGRIVTVASKSHYRAKDIPFEFLREPTKSYTGLPEYEVSKLCNVLFSAHLADVVKDRGITTYSLHPGVVASDIWKRIAWPFRSLIKIWMISNEEGARTTLYCASSEQAGKETGLYYDKERVKRPSRVAQDKELACKLWEASLAFCGEK